MIMGLECYWRRRLNKITVCTENATQGGEIVEHSMALGPKKNLTNWKQILLTRGDVQCIFKNGSSATEKFFEGERTQSPPSSNLRNRIT